MIPAALNRGWAYHDRIGPASAGLPVIRFYTSRYPHSGEARWSQRLEAGEILRNGAISAAETPLQVGDRLIWRRPPWLEPAVPSSWPLLFDDGDLHVIAKPAGLPVLPAGGYLEHTLLRLLERRFAGDRVPRPIHRLGRFTSGLLVCAREAATRAWLSDRFRERGGACRKIYRTLTVPGGHWRRPGETLAVDAPIARADHPRLGRIWCAAAAGRPVPGALQASSRLQLLARRSASDLLEVEILTGRPHQIRIHCAVAGAPLLGDPLYEPGGVARADGLPGEGGYRLHAHRLTLPRPSGDVLDLEAPLPAELVDVE